MEEKRELAENTATNLATGGAEENNLQGQVSVVPVVSLPRLTMKDFEKIDDLYDAYMQGKLIELPPWLGEKEKERGLETYPQELYLYLKKNDHIISVKSGNSRGLILYHYEDEYYKKWNESNCKAYIKSYIPSKIRTASDWEKVYKELITDYANTEESELDADENIINFKNGILDLTTGKLLPHDPKYLCTRQIQCNYIPTSKLSKAPTTTMKFLRELTGGNSEDMITIWETAGLIISNVPGWRFKQLLILKGPGNTGKSVWREVITSIVGEENCATPDMEQLHSRFGMSEIQGKRLVRKWRVKVC